jgi:hypothetical protein
MMGLQIGLCNPKVLHDIGRLTHMEAIDMVNNAIFCQDHELRKKDPQKKKRSIYLFFFKWCFIVGSMAFLNNNISIAEIGFTLAILCFIIEIITHVSRKKRDT